MDRDEILTVLNTDISNFTNTINNQKSFLKNLMIGLYTAGIALIVTINISDIPTYGHLKVYLLFFPLAMLLSLAKTAISNIFQSKEESKKQTKGLIKNKAKIEGLLSRFNILLGMIIYPTLISAVTLLILLGDFSIPSITHLISMLILIIPFLYFKHLLNNQLLDFSSKNFELIGKHSKTPDILLISLVSLAIIPLLTLLYFNYNSAFEGYYKFTALAFALILGINKFSLDYFILKSKLKGNLRSLGRLYRLRENLLNPEKDENLKETYDEYMERMGIP